MAYNGTVACPFGHTCLFKCLSVSRLKLVQVERTKSGQTRPLTPLVDGLLSSCFSHTFLQLHLNELQSVIDFGKRLKKVHGSNPVCMRQRHA